MSACRKAALMALNGVGDKSRGEWRQWTGKAFHVRRRLTSQEELLTGPAVDIRGTSEAKERAETVLREAPYVPREFVYEEISENTGIV